MSTESATGRAKIQNLKPPKSSPRAGHYRVWLQFLHQQDRLVCLFVCLFRPLGIHVYTFRLHTFQGIISVPREPFCPHYRSWGRQEMIWHSPKPWELLQQDHNQLSTLPQRAETEHLACWSASAITSGLRLQIPFGTGSSKNKQRNADKHDLWEHFKICKQK